MRLPPPCPEWADLLAAQASADLSSAQRAALARHLASCPTCAQASADYATLTARVRAATQEDRFLGLTHQWARLRTEIIAESSPDRLAPAPPPDGSSLPPPSFATPGTRRSTRAWQARSGQGLEGLLRVAGSVQIHYHILGSGPHPVLIPAVRWPIAACEELLEQHTLVFYDRHQRPALTGSVPPLSAPEEELEALRRHLGLAQVSLVGWSHFGGMTTRYALEHAKRIARLLLIRPVSTLQAWQSAPTHRQETGEREQARFWWGTDVDHPSAPGKSIALPGASSSPIPTLVIHGGDDPLPVSSSQTWATSLPNARFLAMPGVGMTPWNDAPHPFFAAVRQFLLGAWPPGAVCIETKGA